MFRSLISLAGMYTALVVNVWLASEGDLLPSLKGVSLPDSLKRVWYMQRGFAYVQV